MRPQARFRSSIRSREADGRVAEGAGCGGCGAWRSGGGQRSVTVSQSVAVGVKGQDGRGRQR